jgi:DNA modification methylase
MTIIQGDCLEVMRGMEANSIDFIVTDPPYGLHFMGKDWDGRIPAIEIWAEALRIAKPGSMLAAFGGSRTHHHLMCAIEGAGWEIRDVIMYLYGSGFPKSHNFGRKMEGAWTGFGTALKPSYEPIILAMKPLEGTFAQNAEKWGVAGINIDESRIGTGGTKRSHQSEYPKNENGTEDRSQHWARTGHLVESNGMGRWPANIIFDEEAAGMLDEQTGTSKSSSGYKRTEMRRKIYNLGQKPMPDLECGYNDSGGASRFFYCAKASSSERNRGLEGMSLKDSNKIGHFKELGQNGYKKNSAPMSNSHPTVKPIALMKYIIKLLAPPGNPTLLDPFAGSGSTLVAAKELGINAIGIEKEEEYCKIARKRIEYVDKIRNAMNFKASLVSNAHG